MTPSEPTASDEPKKVLGRFLVRASISVAAGADQHFNPALQGRLGDVIERIAPDDVYFIIDKGPCIFLIVSVCDMSELPVIAETLWLGLSAEVTITPVLTIGDIQQARPRVKQAIDAYRPLSASV